MKPLQKHFLGRGEVRGYLFSQIRQTDKAFIYEVNSNGSRHCEVFKKIINKLYVCVSYPTSKAFGIWAWTYMSLEEGNNKFNELNK